MGVNPEIEAEIWGSVGPAPRLKLFTFPRIGLTVYVKAELDLLPQDVEVQISQPQAGSTLDGREGITLNARVEGDPQLRLLAGVDFTLRDGRVDEACQLPQTESISRVVRPDIPDECRCTAALPRGGKIQPFIPDGNLREGWIHIDARHITGDHPRGPGDLFEPGTTRAELESAAIRLVQTNRVSTPGIVKQEFEDRIIVNGKRDRIRVVINANTCAVITIFPVRS